MIAYLIPAGNRKRFGQNPLPPKAVRAMVFGDKRKRGRRWYLADLMIGPDGVGFRELRRGRHQLPPAAELILMIHYGSRPKPHRERLPVWVAGPVSPDIVRKKAAAALVRNIEGIEDPRAFLAAKDEVRLLDLVPAVRGALRPYIRPQDLPPLTAANPFLRYAGTLLTPDRLGIKDGTRAAALAEDAQAFDAAKQQVQDWTGLPLTDDELAQLLDEGRLIIPPQTVLEQERFIRALPVTPDEVLEGGLLRWNRLPAPVIV